MDMRIDKIYRNVVGNDKMNTAPSPGFVCSMQIDEMKAIRADIPKNEQRFKV